MKNTLRLNFNLELALTGLAQKKTQIKQAKGELMFTRYSFSRALLLRFSLAMLVQDFKTGEFSRQNVAC